MAKQELPCRDVGMKKRQSHDISVGNCRQEDLVPPMLWIPHQLVGATEGLSVTLECFSEAHPTSLNYWTKGDGQMIHESKKYQADTSIGNPSYKTHMKLTIYSVSMDDDGMYKCVAKNPRGETDGTIRLYVSNPPTSPHRTSSTEPPDDSLDDDDFDDFGRLKNSIEKNVKYQSNLNDINRFEQKSSIETIEKGFGWPTDTLSQATKINSDFASICWHFVAFIFIINRICRVFLI